MFFLVELGVSTRVMCTPISLLDVRMCKAIPTVHCFGVRTNTYHWDPPWCVSPPATPKSRTSFVPWKY